MHPTPGRVGLGALLTLGVVLGGCHAADRPLPLAGHDGGPTTADLGVVDGPRVPDAADADLGVDAGEHVADAAPTVDATIEVDAGPPDAGPPDLGPDTTCDDFVCGTSCATSTDCTGSGPGWSCATTVSRCVCAPTSAVELCGDGVDSDCDGTLTPCLWCGTADVDPRSDMSNCGACGVTCPLGGACDAGTCACPADTIDCGGTCLDTRSDITHCGGCDTTCPSGAACTDGACVCPSGLEACTTTCADLASDEAHCGDCATSCALGATCNAGVCECPSGTLDCGATCATVATDAANCGACGQVCGGRCVTGRCIDVLDVAAAHGATCALMRDGHVECWGGTRTGTLGDSTMSGPTYYATPRPVPGIPPATRLAAGDYGICIVTTAGEVYCWGEYPGRDSLGAAIPPTLVVMPEAVTEISVSDVHACVLTTSGSIYCWGENNGAQFGDGTTISSLTPVRANSSVVFASVDAGHDHTCALDRVGAAYCWGNSANGALGIIWWEGSDYGRFRPAPVETTVRFTQLVAGDRFTCARAFGNDLYCWGAYPSAGPEHETPVILDASVLMWRGAFVRLSTVLDDHTCASYRGTAVYCWGSGGSGELGSAATWAAGPQRVPGIGATTRLSTGSDHSCAVTSRTEIYCWGRSYLGELGRELPGSWTATPVSVVW